MVRIRMAYDDHGADSVRTGHACVGESLTQQSFAEEVDINTIVRRFSLTGQLPAAGSVPLVTNGDFVDELTFREAMDIVLTGQRAFESMPADVRNRFGNDAAAFVDFCSDIESNRAELERLGLAIPKAPVESKVVPEAPKA